MIDWLEATAHICVCGHLRIDHADPHYCAIEGCHCGEYEELHLSVPPDDHDDMED
jgi:hypothetical protein